MQIWHLLTLFLFFMLLAFVAIYKDEKWMVMLASFVSGWLSFIVMIGFGNV